MPNTRHFLTGQWTLAFSAGSLSNIFHLAIIRMCTWPRRRRRTVVQNDIHCVTVAGWTTRASYTSHTVIIRTLILCSLIAEHKHQIAKNRLIYRITTQQTNLHTLPFNNFLQSYLYNLLNGHEYPSPSGAKT